MDLLNQMQDDDWLLRAEKCGQIDGLWECIATRDETEQRDTVSRNFVDVHRDVDPCGHSCWMSCVWHLSSFLRNRLRPLRWSLWWGLILKKSYPSSHQYWAKIMKRTPVWLRVQ